ncbi:MAG: hypothetical protein VX988_07285 [Planctomycetota bacterium]|nr:hypothetical protein [Planctomycetota bacterium]
MLSVMLQELLDFTCDRVVALFYLVKSLLEMFRQFTIVLGGGFELLADFFGFTFQLMPGLGQLLNFAANLGIDAVLVFAPPMIAVGMIVVRAVFSIIFMLAVRFAVAVAFVPAICVAFSFGQMFAEAAQSLFALLRSDFSGLDGGADLARRLFVDVSWVTLVFPLAVRFAFAIAFVPAFCVAFTIAVAVRSFVVVSVGISALGSLPLTVVVFVGEGGADGRDEECEDHRCGQRCLPLFRQ